jgi:hypothetical protein
VLDKEPYDVDAQYPKTRIDARLNQFFRILKTHGFLRRVPGVVKTSSLSGPLRKGFALTLFEEVLGTFNAWTSEEGKYKISWKEAKQQFYKDLGKKDEPLMAEIEALFEPTKWFKDLLGIHLNDSDLFKKLRKDSELVAGLQMLCRKLREG